MGPDCRFLAIGPRARDRPDCRTGSGELAGSGPWACAPFSRTVPTLPLLGPFEFLPPPWDALGRSRVNGRKKTRTCARSARRRTHPRPRILGTRTPRRSYDSTNPIEHGPLSRSASSPANGLLVFGTRFADVIKTDSSMTGTHHGSLSRVQVSDSRSMQPSNLRGARG